MILHEARKEKVGKNDDADEGDAKKNADEAAPLFIHYLMQSFTN